MIPEALGKELHDIAVARIASTFSFPRNEFFPGASYPTWKTYTNVPERKMPVEHKWKGLLYPDIVVADSVRSNVPMVNAEVETEDSLTMEQVENWKYLQDTCRTLYVFVPEGAAKRAVNLIFQYRNCMPTLLRTYGFDDLWNLRITCV